MAGLRIGVALATVGLLLATDAVQNPRRDRMDRTGAFYRPAFASSPEQVLAETTAGPIDVATYLRYLAGAHGTDLLDELAFDVLLERECDARGVGRTAPLLARSQATQRLHDSGRGTGADVDVLRRKFLNEALRSFRADAIVRADRRIGDETVRALFERRYGAGGRQVRVGHILVSNTATRRRLRAEGLPADPSAVRAAAGARAAALLERIRAGAPPRDLLGESDDKRTRELLDDPARAAAAGVLDEVADARYGQAFFDAARALEAGEATGPVQTRLGLHLIWLVDVRTTRLEDVGDALRAELRAGPATREEVEALRRTLFDRYGYRPL